MKYVLINQPAGLGDIFYLQKAAKLLEFNDYKIIWPVIKEFEYVKDYLKYKNITFVNKEHDFLFKDLYEQNHKQITEHAVGNDTVLVLPLVHSLPKNKYSSLNLTDKDWQTHFSFERNHEREQKLKEKYGIKDGEEFIFINNIFASPPDMITRDISISTDKKIIYNNGEPCHVFDFCWLFENASELHLVESSFCYFIEVLDTKGKLFMYSRKINGRNQHPNFDYVNHIYKKDWIKIN